MKKFILLLLVFLIALSSVAYAAPKPRVSIYTSMYEDIIEAMTKTMREKFPDYDIEFFYGGTGTLQAKIAKNSAVICSWLQTLHMLSN